MRILMVSDVYFPRINGVSASIETFRKTLRECDIEVEIVVPRYGDEAEEEGIIRVRGSSLPFSMDPEDRRVSWRGMRSTVRERARNCDLIHVQTPFIAHYAGIKAARELNKPVIATYHTLFAEYLQYYVPLLPHRPLSFIARCFSRRQCNALDAVIVPSGAMHDELAQYGVEVPLHVLPTGISLPRFAGGARLPFRAKYRIADDRPVGLFVGRVAHEKNIGFLLRMWAKALENNPELLLLIVGDGPAMPDLQRMATSLGIERSVRFLGYLDREGDLLDCYAAADVFVFSSLTETQGMVLPEAMAAGLPVIALSRMGTCDILEPGKGCIVPPENEQSFAKAVVDFFADKVLRYRLKEEAVATAANWSDIASTRRLAAIYRSLKR